MVFLMELEGDGISWLGDEVVGLERENASTTNNDTMVRTSGDGGRLGVHNDWSGGRSGERGRGGRGWRRSSVAHCARFESSELVSWVHGEDHSLLTVISLATVHPNWLGVTDIKPSSGEGPIYVLSGDRYATIFVS